MRNATVNATSNNAPPRRSPSPLTLAAHPRRRPPSQVKSNLMAANNESGAFLDSCHHHCGSWNTIRIDGDLVSGAIQKWYDSIGQAGAKKLWNQNKPYPCTACCNMK
jgi:hypothetical protein